MQKLKTKLKNTSDYGLFHDSRADVRLLKNVINLLHDKINELIDELELLKQQIK